MAVCGSGVVVIGLGVGEGKGILMVLDISTTATVDVGKGVVGMGAAKRKIECKFLRLSEFVRSSDYMHGHKNFSPAFASYVSKARCSFDIICLTEQSVKSAA